MAHGHADGHDKEPRSFFGGKGGVGGSHPLVHSHSKTPKRHIRGAHHKHVGKRLGMKVQGKSR
jgi:hypothetical protein